MKELTEEQRKRLDEITAEVDRLSKEAYELVAPTDEELDDLRDQYLGMGDGLDELLDQLLHVANDVQAMRDTGLRQKP